MVKCDRVELTGLLARKDYEQLLCRFLASLEQPVKNLNGYAEVNEEFALKEVEDEVVIEVESDKAEDREE